MPKHTPGPWWITRPIRGSSVQHVRAQGPHSNKAAVAKIYTYRGTESAEADAHLIAAAPELLEAAIKVILAFDPPDQGDPPSLEERATALELLDDAIAKAEGR